MGCAFQKRELKEELEATNDVLLLEIVSMKQAINKAKEVPATKDRFAGNVSLESARSLPSAPFHPKIIKTNVNVRCAKRPEM